MRIAVLGPVMVDGDGDSLGPRDRVVLEALALTPGDVVRMGRLADALWGDTPPPSWNKVLQGCVVRLRKALGSDVIETVAEGYRLTESRIHIDVVLFEQQIRRGREMMAEGDAERAAHVLADALGMWRGRPFADLEDWDPGRIEAERLREIRHDAQDLLIEAGLRTGRHDELLGEAQARVAEAPLRERRWELLARAEYQAGRQAEALRTLRRARAYLATETGLDPGPGLAALEDAILRQDPAIASRMSVREPSSTCPYRGLLHFEPEDSETFFGRERATVECLRTLAEVGTLAVVGPSGSGKSSLVRAGVVAALRRDGQRVALVTPRGQPTAALQGALVGGAPEVLVVDQCEEIFAPACDPEERARFLNAVADQAEHTLVVVALRADRLGQVTEAPRFARLIQRGLHLLGAMNEEELRAAIEGPAHQAGLLAAPALVDLLVREVEGEPGALPLMSHALRSTWENREGRLLTTAAYHETGGIRAAVARSAETAYAGATEAQQATMRDVILRMVEPTGDGDPVTSRVSRRLLGSDEPIEAVIGLLIDARLVTSDGATVGLAHEALVRAWPRLQDWLDDDIEGQRILRHLTLAAAGWDAMAQPDSELYRGARLSAALEWRERARPTLTSVELAFLDAGDKRAGQELRDAADRARRQARVNRQLRILLGIAGALLGVAMVAGLLAVRSAQRADAEALVSEARRIGAQALLEDDPDLSLLLAVQSLRLDESPDTVASLLASLTKHPLLIASRPIGGVGFDVSASPDGMWIAVGSFGGGEIRRADGLGDATAMPGALLLSYDPTGNLLALGAAAESVGEGVAPVRLVNASTFEADPNELAGVPANAVPWSIGWDTSGRRLAVSFLLLDPNDPRAENGTILIWDVESLDGPAQRIDLPVGTAAPALTLSPDGSTVYVSSPRPTPFLRSYDVATGRLIASVAAESRSAPAVSPDGSLVAAEDLGDVVLFGAADLTEQSRLSGHDGDILDLAFSRDGSRLASTSVDQTVVVWDPATAEQVAVLRGHTGPVRSAAFSPDGRTLYTTGADQSLLTWDLAGDRRFLPLRAVAEVDDWPGEALVAPDGSAVAYTLERLGDAGDPEMGVQVLEVGEGTTSEWLDPGHGQWGALAWHPDAGHFATTGADGVVRVWERTSLRLVAERKVAGGHVAGLDYSADGSHLVVGERDGRVFALDGETLASVGTPVHLDRRIVWTFARSSSDLAVAVTAGGFVVVDVDGGIVLHEEATDAASAALSPQGDRLAVLGSGGAIGLFDVGKRTWIAPMANAHRGTAFPRSFASDGALYATGGLDNRVLLWNGAHGTLLGSLPADYGLIPMPAFRPDDRTIMLASVDWPRATVHEWDTDLNSWIEYACQVAGRNLTLEEWGELVGERPYAETCP